MTTALASDIPQLVILINSAYRGDTSKKGWTTEADLIKGERMNTASLTKMLGSTDIIFRKCVDIDHQIVGCASLEMRKDELYTSLLTVSPEIQANGIGKLILNDAEAIARKRGLTSLVLDVISLRTELIDYYIRRGFEATGKIFDFPVENEFGSQPLQSLKLVEFKKHLVM